MVVSCCSYGCSNRFGKLKEDGSKLQFHSFPFKNPEMLIKWIRATRRINWHPTRSTRICAEHFSMDSYRTSAQRYLKDDAVPSIFDFPSHLQKPQKKRRRIEMHILPSASKDEESQQAMPLNSPQDEESHQAMPLNSPIDEESQQTMPLNSPEDEESQQAMPLNSPKESQAMPLNSPKDEESQQAMPLNSPKESQAMPLNSPEGEESQQAIPLNSPTKALMRKIKILQQRLKRRDKKISDLTSLLSTMQTKCGMSNDTAESYGRMPFSLLVHQLQNSKVKPNGRRYSPSMKEFALTMYSYSPQSYDFLRKIICLPHPAQLRSWISSLTCSGFMEDAYSYVKQCFENEGDNFEDPSCPDFPENPE